ncbi:MAG TPA: serine--tRNA ligase [Microscillaceae bacterium]|jgi:seryl-tRNA synthetase|nr:serine--tRNA ligase [Microscillaceae bacterium]
MLQIHQLKNQQEAVLAGLQKRNFKQALSLVQQAIDLDDQRRALQARLDDTLAQSNQLAKSIGALMKQGKTQEAEQQKQTTTELKQTAKTLQEQLSEVEEALHQVLVQIPNIPHASVVGGKSAEDNQVVFQVDALPQLPEGALPHWELIAQYNLIDFELGSKITGAGFPVYRGKGAKLQRALISFFLDEATKAGYEEIIPPLLVNADSGFGTGQLPDKEGQMYTATADDLYLIPTAEVPITNLYRNVILQEKALPIRNVGYTPCFRREAGSWGAHVRGLNRLHQFDKVEIVHIEHPSKSYETLENMRQYVEGLLQKLELPYRVLALCGGDMGFTSAKTYDLEVWSAGQQRWLEVSSVSNFETFQSVRLKLRFKDAEGKTQWAHTLNGSALALPRIVAAILENNQTTQAIAIPKVLQPYAGFDHIPLP